MSLKITVSALDRILFLGKQEYSFTIRDHHIIFNMATVGELSTSIAASGTGELDQKAARMASSLVSVDGYGFQKESDNTFIEKYRFLKNLQAPVFDLFWDEYNAAIAIQYKNFEDFLADGKKSVPTQDSEIAGISTNDSE